MSETDMVAGRQLGLHHGILSEDELEFALKAGRFGIWSLDLTTEELTSSEICRLNFGRDPTLPFSYAELRDAVHPDDRERMQAAVATSIASGDDYDIEYRLITPGGDLRWAQIRAQPSYDANGRPVKLSGVSIDITGPRSAEQTYHDIADRLNLVVEHAEVGFWDVDPIHHQLVWPARTKAMFGISPDVPVTIDDFYNGLHVDDREATSSAYAAAADPDRRALYDVEYRTIGKEDGLIRWVAAKGRGVFNDAGSCVRIVGTAIDITAKKKAEEALSVLNDTLEARVAERTDQLEAAHDQLRQSQKMEAIGQLTGGVAHDFNNLLTVIRGSVDLLRRPDITAERRERYVNAIGETADRAAKLTGQLLAFARRQALSPELFDVGASIDDVGNMVRTLTGSRIALDLKPPKVPLYVLADRSQLDTAIVNLAINARDAMNGEGRLTIAVGAVSNIPARRSHDEIAGDFAAIAITDEGTGIAADDLERVFEPFYTTKATGEGTGLGLSQVFGFVKQSGGDVTVESQLGRGTTFTLYLPRVESDGHLASFETREVRGDGMGVCVLVVEDNASVGDFALAALQDLGFDSVLARDGEQALAELEKDCARFHILFTDVVMPGIGGIELAQRVRADYPHLPVILTSGYSHVLAENGAHGFELLHKPYSVDQLSRVLHKAIAWHDHVREPAH
ncbi:PAS domain S-box protein [Sphingomonas panacisoli]|uniref:histidine kinase n=1 Tax=Sphingomonas panacisoli TaxID=1813879 RepID=A0A5B8LF32_9SPHN|nr:PAS domain-containing hybrid sensor histidine kinase/response regulator [Sphingomonas panacisoli]QDZ06828.1 PAS domain S-box protein [Sphingomonas panacisoli]